jgi:hypothetical protein
MPAAYKSPRLRYFIIAAWKTKLYPQSGYFGSLVSGAWFFIHAKLEAMTLGHYFVVCLNVAPWWYPGYWPRMCGPLLRRAVTRGHSYGQLWESPEIGLKDAPGPVLWSNLHNTLKETRKKRLIKGNQVEMLIVGNILVEIKNIADQSMLHVYSEISQRNPLIFTINIYW